MYLNNCLITILEIYKTFVPKELVQILEKILWCEFEEVDKSASLNNNDLANKNKVDNDEIDKNKTESYIIANFVTFTITP